MTTKPYRIGIDLGGTKIETLLVEPDGGHRVRRRVATPRGGPGEYDAICVAVTDLIRQSAEKVPAGRDYTVGIGIPGTIHPRTGRVQNANTTSLIGRPFQKDLSDRLGRPVAMDNDANCFALAEARQGAGRGYGMVFGVIMGTGCGGGLVIDGRVRTGPHRIAGEWGHFAVDPSGAQCYCGNYGCVETLISGSGVAVAFSKRTGRSLSMEQIVAGVRNGDDDCRKTMARFFDDFGRCLGGLISILDPDAVVLGGGLANIDALYTRGIDRVRHYAFHDHLTTPILKHQLGDSAGVIGAAWIGR